MTWDECRTQLDIPRLKALRLYWDKHPPVHVMLGAFFGIKPAEKKDDQFMLPFTFED